MSDIAMHVNISKATKSEAATYLKVMERLEIVITIFLTTSISVSSATLSIHGKVDYLSYRDQPYTAG
jgi:hypothetical protein